MEVFEMILIMLGAVFLSNVLSRFIPDISVPLIQIGLGILIDFALDGFHIEINQELFLLLFMAPLLFNDGRNANKESLWKLRRPIFLLAILLVFVTVFLLGTFVEYLIPTIPFAAAFALAAALAPTDAVAVSSLAEKVKVPKKAMHILEGESLINDASGLVSFQFAILALTTGKFSIIHAGMSFVIISLGGVLLGLILSLFKTFLMRYLRSLGIENIISFMLMDILTPFIIFLLAEGAHVNGILAVVSAGIVQSLGYDKMNPESANLNNITRNTWTVLSFSLNGAVFVLLGTQIPSIMKKVWVNEEVANSRFIIFIIIITVILLGLRLILIFLLRAFSEEKKKFKYRLRDSFLYTISGVRGTITLVSALSLPAVIQNGKVFKEQQLLIAIAASVILLTLILANFILPLFAEKKDDNKSYVREAELSILRGVIDKLKTQRINESELSLHFLIQVYNQRIFQIIKGDMSRDEGTKLMIKILNWKIEKALELQKLGSVSEETVNSFISKINKRIFLLTHNKNQHYNIIYSIKGTHLGKISLKKRKRERYLIDKETKRYVYEKLKNIDKSNISKEVYEFHLTRYEPVDFGKMDGIERSEIQREVEDLSEYAIQIERDLIQQYFEKGLISRNEMKEYRGRVLVMEKDLLNQYM